MNLYELGWATRNILAERYSKKGTPAEDKKLYQHAEAYTATTESLKKSGLAHNSVSS